MAKVDLKIEHFRELKKCFVLQNPLTYCKFRDSVNKPLSYAYSLEKIFIS
jgi:hypothetical protein